ncbi:cell wall lytic activity [Gracilibacillus boraciitolerans JCM 21714]|uniref:Cell wall lytic activity n=1 Tax=Gracilibacillus boraciitolerans JCM 21714 TaxID=1298598 RepID=W4VK71_9BACI|nr:peptidoglycan endopeptidase [Gracilibacillus boraciitolerans]GAE93164.1 cell wall lytic activity [Gracilibacillus boraciitolerans JCM 21714]
MANKKVIMSVTLGAAIAAATIGVDEAEAASYKVQSGDSLWKIAQKYNTNVQSLIDMNKLRSDIIYPNQVLKTDASSSGSKTNNAKDSKSQNNQPTNSSSSKYTVKSGDTLSGIASKHSISLNDLMKWNNLNTTLIYPGNVFIVSKPSSNHTTSDNNNKNTSSSNSSSINKNNSASTSVYTIKSGDTLSHIGTRYGVTVTNLKKWNNLSSDRIYIGQKLNVGVKNTTDTSSVNKPTTEKEKPAGVDYNVSTLIEVATALQGSAYVWGGTTTSGFDCSGYIYYVYKQAGKEMGRYSSTGYYDRSYYVNNPKVGDLVFFEGTYKSGISHLGIYVGDNQFIHAGSKGVEIVSLNNSYWKKHFSSFKRFY